MVDWSLCPRTTECAVADAAQFHAQVQAGGRPAVLRGLVAQWPAVAAARDGDAALCAYLRDFGGAQPVDAFFGAPAMRGRFFYTDDCLSFNFARRSLPLAELLGLLIEYRNAAEPPSLYAGAVRAHTALPGFSAANPAPLLDAATQRLESLWVGNRTRIGAHWDLPQNLICVIGGRRRYTLFPPEQIGNLYPGPVENSPAGQPISMVDFHAPDLARYPRFIDALQSAQVAELAPGDALYLPSLWWHHAESLDPVGVMANYWWRDAQPYMTTPSSTLQHALLTLRDLPHAERMAWRSFFDYYIFAADGDTMAHLPAAARGVFGSMDEEVAARLRAHLAHTLQW